MHNKEQIVSRCDPRVICNEMLPQALRGRLWFTFDIGREKLRHVGDYYMHAALFWGPTVKCLYHLFGHDIR